MRSDRQGGDGESVEERSDRGGESRQECRRGSGSVSACVPRSDFWLQSKTHKQTESLFCLARLSQDVGENKRTLKALFSARYPARSSSVLSGSVQKIALNALVNI